MLSTHKPARVLISPGLCLKRPTLTSHSPRGSKGPLEPSQQQSLTFKETPNLGSWELLSEECTYGRSHSHGEIQSSLRRLGGRQNLPGPW